MAGGKFYGAVGLVAIGALMARSNLHPAAAITTIAHTSHKTTGHVTGHRSHEVEVAIGYARAQLGKPYQWGGSGPDAYDCSGLTMQSAAAAGVHILRTSQEQYAEGPHVAHGAAGDLVFFAGADGTPTAPGHVGLVIGPGRMIEAYGTGWPIRVSTYGRPTSPPGDQVVVGFTDPLGRG